MAEVRTQERQLGRSTRHAEEETHEWRERRFGVPEIVLTSAAGASIITSLVLFLKNKKAESTFVGQWGPMILLGGLFYEILRSRRS